MVYVRTNLLQGSVVTIICEKCRLIVYVFLGCSKNEIQCSADDQYECVAIALLCDGTVDCDNGADENFQCCQGSFYRFCNNNVAGTCVRDTLWCDGYPDCNNSEDEDNCSADGNFTRLKVSGLK